MLVILSLSFARDTCVAGVGVRVLIGVCAVTKLCSAPAPLLYLPISRLSTCHHAAEPKSGTTWLARVIVELCLQLCGNPENTW